MLSCFTFMEVLLAAFNSLDPPRRLPLAEGISFVAHGSRFIGIARAAFYPRKLPGISNFVRASRRAFSHAMTSTVRYLIHLAESLTDFGPSPR